MAARPRMARQDPEAACLKTSSSSSSTAACPAAPKAEAAPPATPQPSEPPAPAAGASGEGEEASVDFLVDALLESGSIEHVQAALAELQSCVQTLRPFRGRTVTPAALQAAVQAAVARFRAGPPAAGAGGGPGPAEPSLEAVHAQARPGLPRGLPAAVQARLGQEGAANFEDIAAGRPQPVVAFGRAVQEWAALAGGVQATLAAAEAALSRGPELRALASQVEASVRECERDGSTPRVLVLGGLGLGALAAERARADATVLVRGSWQRGLARRALDARGSGARVVLGGAASLVPSCKGFDLLCIEGLDRASLGAGLWLRTARELLASTPKEAFPAVLPSSAAVFAVLVEVAGLRDCAGFNLAPAAAGLSLSPSTVELEVELAAGEEPPKTSGALRLLSRPFQAFKLWDSAQALAELAPTEEAELTVEAVSSGRCDAVAFFVVQDSESAEDFVGRRSRVGVQWLGRGAASLECGGRASVAVHRNLSRVSFALSGAAAGLDPEEEARPPERAFLEPERLAALADPLRNAAYDGAIRRAVQSAGKDVRALDVGSGSGLLMMMANRAGARLVRGVERAVDLAQTSFEVFDANGMDQQDHCDMEVVCADLLKSQRGPDEAPYDVVVADLLDHSGVGGGIVPLLRHARKSYLREGGVVIPRKLTIFALLVDVGGEEDDSVAAAPWPASAFFLGGCPGAEDASPVAADLGDGGLRCRPLSEPKEVLAVDLGAPESLRSGGAEVLFQGAADGLANAVCWFWLADLDGEASLSNAPSGILSTEDTAGSDCLRRALEHGRTHWRQALQAIGPVAVRRGKEVQAQLQVEETKLSWKVQAPAGEDVAQLLPGSGPSAAALLSEYKSFFSAWATLRCETLAELEQAAWSLLSRDPDLRRQQLLAALELLSQACAFRGVVSCPTRELLARLSRGAFA